MVKWTRVVNSRHSAGEAVFDVINYLLIFLLCIATVYPFWYSFVLSISSRASVTGIGFHLWPGEIDFSSWKLLLKPPYMWQGLYNTLLRTVGGAAIAVVLTVMTAYPLAKKSFPNRNLFTGIIVFTMLFNGGLIPTFILVKNLGIMNTIWALMLPIAISPFNVIIVRNFFKSIPESMEEAAKIDGANDIYVLLKIVIPLSLPVLATVTLWIIVGYWNSWFDAVMYLNDRSRFVLQQMLREIVILNMPDPSINVPETGAVMPLPESIKAAATLFVTVPVLLVYPFLQKYFTKGIMVGSLKA